MVEVHVASTKLLSVKVRTIKFSQTQNYIHQQHVYMCTCHLLLTVCLCVHLLTVRVYVCVCVCVCGRYRDGIGENDQLVQWLWQTLTSFTNEERTLFLRFVSGRSRLPARVSEIPQRFQIMTWGQVRHAAERCNYSIQEHERSCPCLCPCRLWMLCLRPRLASSRSDCPTTRHRRS